MLLGILTAGCDLITGIRTYGVLDQTVDGRCIDQSIRRVAGIGEISYRTFQTEAFQLLPYRGRVITVSQVWTYGPAANAILQMQDDGERHSYSNGLMTLGHGWSSSEMEAFRPLMERVNEALERQCGLPLKTMARTMQD